MKTYTLGELADMKYGKLPPKQKLANGCPVFTGYGVSGYADNYLYEQPMLVVVARGVGGTGNVRISPPKSWITNLAIVLDLDGTKADKKFLCYFLGQQDLKDKLNTGSAQAQITINVLSRFQVTIPPLAEQRRIASILSAYDDLIENNTRRIAILEEVARRIYEEWFVRFRFPGHEHARMVESELGPVPDGWQRTTLRDIARVNQRSIKRGGEPDQIVYVDISSVSTGSIDKREPMPFAEAPGRARRIVGDGDIIWACVRPNRKSFSLVLEPEENLVVSTGFAVLSAESVPWTFLYQAVTTETFVSYLVNHATGAAYPAVGAADFENADVLVPDNAVLRAFNDIVEPMARLISKLRQKNTNLRTTRDLLLPKLISGELDVSALPEPEAVTA